MVPSDCSEQEWSQSPSQSTYRQPPAMEIGIKCQNKPPVRLKCVSLFLQSQHIGIKCENKPPVRLKRASSHPQAHISINCENKPPVRLKRASSHPQAHISIKCENKPPVRLKRASSHPHAQIGIKCQEKPPVRLKSVSAATQPARNMAKKAVSGVRPEEEPQGSIWFLTQAILLFPQHPPAMDNSSQQEDRIPTSVKHASMCLRPSHAKKIGIGCADKPPVRLKSFNIYRMDRDQEQLIS